MLIDDGSLTLGAAFIVTFTTTFVFGILLLAGGVVVGINAAYNQEAQGIAFAISSETVNHELSTQLNAPKVSGDLHGLSCKEEVEGDRREPHSEPSQCFSCLRRE
jgi:hypothetical protein